jgi:predicted nucleotidyltransferase
MMRPRTREPLCVPRLSGSSTLPPARDIVFNVDDVCHRQRSILEGCSAEMTVTTLAERKRMEAARRNEAARSIMAELRGYAAAHGGRFVVFGSAAKGTIGFASDIDIMVDFPEQTEAQAFRFAEDVCRKYDLVGDLHSKSTTKLAFIDRIAAHARMLG